MKTIINLVIMLFCVVVFGQEQKVDYKKLSNDLVKVTYYYADNSNLIEREGFFNDGKLHGTWVNYDVEGNTTTIANYSNGKKDGVWTYFKKDKVNVITYKLNKIVNVEEKTLAVN